MRAMKRNCSQRCKPFYYIFAMFIARQIAIRLAYVIKRFSPLDVERWGVEG